MQREGQKNKRCSKCEENFNYSQKDTKWIDYGTYSTKIVKCPYCESIQVIKYEDAFGLYLNKDKRYYY